MPERKPHLDALASCLLLGCCVFWGLQQVLVKITLAEVPPVWQAGLRFILAAVTLLIWMGWRRIPMNVSDGSQRVGWWVGCLFSAEFVCLYLGMQHTTASRLTIFLYTSPFWVALLLPLWVKSERMARMQWVGLVLAFAAVALALHEGLNQASTPNMGWGDALALGAGAFWGLTTVSIRSTAAARLSPEKLLLYQVAHSALCLPVLAWAMGEDLRLDYSLLAWGSILIQGLVGAFGSYLIWMWMLGRYQATQLSTFAFLTPVFALMFSTLWLGEPLTVPLLVALGGVACGIVLVNRKPNAT
jgi:drug/metabolite transporter (DMT)-like permease